MREKNFVKSFVGWPLTHATLIILLCFPSGRSTELNVSSNQAQDSLNLNATYLSNQSSSDAPMQNQESIQTNFYDLLQGTNFLNNQQMILPTQTVFQNSNQQEKLLSSALLPMVAASLDKENQKSLYHKLPWPNKENLSPTKLSHASVVRGIINKSTNSDTDRTSSSTQQIDAYQPSENEPKLRANYDNIQSGANFYVQTQNNALPVNNHQLQETQQMQQQEQQTIQVPQQQVAMTQDGPVHSGQLVQGGFQNPYYDNQAFGMEQMQQLMQQQQNQQQQQVVQEPQVSPQVNVQQSTQIESNSNQPEHPEGVNQMIEDNISKENNDIRMNPRVRKYHKNKKGRKNKNMLTNQQLMSLIKELKDFNSRQILPKVNLPQAGLEKEEGEEVQATRESKQRRAKSKPSQEINNQDEEDKNAEVLTRLARLLTATTSNLNNKQPSNHGSRDDDSEDDEPHSHFKLSNIDGYDPDEHDELDELDGPHRGDRQVQASRAMSRKQRRSGDSLDIDLESDDDLVAARRRRATTPKRTMNSKDRRSSENASIETRRRPSISIKNDSAKNNGEEQSANVNLISVTPQVSDQQKKKIIQGQEVDLEKRDNLDHRSRQRRYDGMDDGYNEDERRKDKNSIADNLAKERAKVISMRQDTEIEDFLEGKDQPINERQHINKRLKGKQVERDDNDDETRPVTKNLGNAQNRFRISTEKRPDGTLKVKAGDKSMVMKLPKNVNNGDNYYKMDHQTESYNVDEDEQPQNKAETRHKDQPINEGVSNKIDALSGDLDKYFNDSFLAEAIDDPNRSGIKPDSSQSVNHKAQADAPNNMSTDKSDQSDPDSDIDLDVDAKDDGYSDRDDEKDINPKRMKQNKQRKHGGEIRRQSIDNANKISRNVGMLPTRPLETARHNFFDPVDSENMETPIGPDSSVFARRKSSGKKINAKSRPVVNNLLRQKLTNVVHKPDRGYGEQDDDIDD